MAMVAEAQVFEQNHHVGLEVHLSKEIVLNKGFSKNLV